MMSRLKHIMGFGILLLLATGIVLSCETEGTVDTDYKNYFIKYYGGDGDQEARDFILNEDGSVMMVGISTENSKRKIYIVKADAEGNVLRSIKTGSDSEDVTDIDVFQAGPYEGLYMILSNSGRTDGGTDIKVLIVDFDGNSVDSVMFNDYSTQFGYGLTALADGGFIVTGNTDSTPLPLDNDPDEAGFVDEADIISLRYDQDLNPVTWSVSFGGEPYAMGIKIIQTATDEYVYAGYTNAEIPGEVGNTYDHNFTFLKLGITGGPTSVVAMYVGDSQLDERMTAFARSSSGRFMAVGTQEDGNEEQIFVSVINPSITQEIDETDHTFNIMPEGQSESVGVIPASSGSNEYWFLGNQILQSGRNIWVARVNDDLKTQFSITFGGANNDDTGSAILEAPNGDVLILATMELVNQKKMALIKVRPDGSFE